MASISRDLAKNQFLFSNSLFKFFCNQRPDRNSNDQLFLILAISVFLIPLPVLLIYELLMEENSLQSTLKSIQKFLTGFIFYSIYVNTYIKFIPIRFLLKRFKIDNEIFSNEEELNILKKYNYQSRCMVYSILFFYDINCFVMIFPPIFNVFLYSIGKLKDNQLTLPLVENNIRHSGLLFYTMLFYESIGIVILTLVGSITMSTFLVCIQHACCQCSIIISKIRQPFEKNHKSDRNNKYFTTLTEEYNWIIDIVNRHRISIQYVKMLRYISDIVYLFVIILAMIIIALNFLCILEFSVLLKTLRDKIECIMYVVGSVFSLYINFYLGQTLLNHSNAVFEELCKVPFYTLSLKTQKLLLFMIAKSRKPSFLSIGNMFVASHEIFASLMRKALSFAMVYYSIQ